MLNVVCSKKNEPTQYFPANSVGEWFRSNIVLLDCTKHVFNFHGRWFGLHDKSSPLDAEARPRPFSARGVALLSQRVLSAPSLSP